MITDDNGWSWIPFQRWIVETLHTKQLCPSSLSNLSEAANHDQILEMKQSICTSAQTWLQACWYDKITPDFREIHTWSHMKLLIFHHFSALCSYNSWPAATSFFCLSNNPGVFKCRFCLRYDKTRVSPKFTDFVGAKCHPCWGSNQKLSWKNCRLHSYQQIGWSTAWV